MSNEFYEDEVDYSRDEIVSEEDDDEEIVYDTTEAYKDDYEYDEVLGRKQKILDKLNKSVLDKDEMDEIFNND